MKARPYCRSCGKPIDKKTETHYVRDEAPGFRELWRNEHLAVCRSKADCQRLVNQEVVSVRYHNDADGQRGESVWSFTTWDGESYADDLFCSGTCAQTFGRMAARAYPDLRSKMAADKARARLRMEEAS